MARIALIVILSAFAVVTVALGKVNADLRVSVAELKRQSLHSKKGDWVPDIDVVDIEGVQRVLGSRSSPHQLVLFFTTKCEYCVKSMPYISELAAGIARLGVETIAVSPEQDTQALRKFAIDHSLKFPIVSLVDEKAIKFYKFNVTPSILFLSRGGRVEYSRIGAVTSNQEVFDIYSNTPLMENGGVISGSINTNQ